MINQIHRNIICSYANQLAGMVGVLTLVPIYTRFLGHQVYGEWLVITTIAAYLTLANIGIDQTLTNRIAEASAKERKAEVRTLISTALFAYSAIAAVLIVTFAYLSPWLSALFIAGKDGKAARSLFLIAALYALALPLNVYLAALRGFERVDQEQTVTAYTSLGRSGGLALSAILGCGLVPLALIQGSAAILRGLVSCLRSWRVIGGADLQPSAFSRATLQDLIRPSFGFFVLQIAGVVGFGLDNLVIGYALGPAAVTHYAVSYSMVMLGATFFTTAIAAAMPTLTARFARMPHESQASSFIFVMRFAMFYVSVCLLVLAIAGPWLLRLWVGRGVFPGLATYRWQLTLLFIQVFIAPAYAVLVASTRHYGAAALHVLESTLNLILSLWWVHRWGLSGVIAGTVVARLFTTAWYIPVAALRTLDIPLRVAIKRLWPAAIVALGVSAGAIKFGLTAKTVMQLPAPITAGLAVLVFTAIYAGLALDHADRRKLIVELTNLRFRIATA